MPQNDRARNRRNRPPPRRRPGKRKFPHTNLSNLLEPWLLAMSSDTGGWTRPVSWFSPASDAIARGAGTTSSTSARASHRRRQRSRGAEAAAHTTTKSRRGSIGETGTSYNNMDSEEDSELDDSSAAGRRQRDRRQQRPTPTLTVILMRLEASMTQYCSELSTPTAPNARKAARVLDIDTLGDAVDPLLEAEWARMVDPLTLLAGAEGWYGGLEHLQAQQQPQQKKASSPSASASTNEQAGSRRQRSRIKRGTMGATDMSSLRMNSGSTSAVREVEPTLFSAANGADTPAPSSSHDGDIIMPSSSSSSLSPEAERIRSIYCKVMKDILILKEILCDPIMAASKSENENKPSSSVQQHRQAAESLSKTLATLVELCSVRRSMIVIHSDIAALGSKLTHTCTTKDETTCNAPASSGGMAVASALHSSLLDLAHRCDEVCKTLPEDASTSTSTSTTSSATAPMVKSMRHEIAATRSALRVCAHLENLR